MLKRLMVLSCLLALCSGCAVQFTGSAPAVGGRYVTATKNNKKAMYYCPEAAAKADCEEVEVEEK